MLARIPVQAFGRLITIPRRGSGSQCALFLAYAACLFLVNHSQANEPASVDSKQKDTAITLLVRDGRVLRGHVDSRTDDDLLWVRISRGNASLNTGLTWDLVQEVRIGNERHSAESFRAIAASSASPSPKLSSIAGTDPARADARSKRVPSPVVSQATRVNALELVAEPANWDRDSHSDGIALRVLPRAIDGRVLAVDGVISVQLIGREFVSGRDDKGFPVLGQWSQRVRSADFKTGEGAIYYLPTHRELDHDPSLLAIGMVQGRLNVAGQGDFEAVAATRLRPYNPIRDQINEHHQRYDSFGRYRGRHVAQSLRD